MLGGWPSDFGHLERAIERVLDRSLAAPARGGSDMMLMPTFAGGARAGAHPMVSERAGMCMCSRYAAAAAMHDDEMIVCLQQQQHDAAAALGTPPVSREHRKLPAACSSMRPQARLRPPPPPLLHHETLTPPCVCLLACTTTIPPTQTPHPVRQDIVETPTDFRITADAPGFTPGDVTVELSQGTLTISGKRQAETMDKTDDGKVVRRERHFSSFTRSFTLPENTKDDGVTATLADGVLTVSVPKTEPQPKPEPKRIAVTGGGGDAAKL